MLLSSFMFPLSRLLWIATLIGLSVQLADNITVNERPESIPTTFDSTGFNQVFNLSTADRALTKGDLQLVFLRFFQYDGVVSQSPPKTYTAAFSIRVDDYSQLVVPNCNYEITRANYMLIPPEASPTGAYRNISLYSVSRNLKTKQNTTICDLPTRQAWTFLGTNQYIADARTVLITLKMGWGYFI
jgi:hypothetical protein